MESQVERIELLKQQLHGLGYHSFQLANIISETVNTGDLNRLSAEERERLLIVLQSYVDFAVKSRALSG